MYKIFLSVRNRLAITTKCITAIKNHSSINHEIYVYDNLTNYKIDEHFMYWNLLYQKGLISQVTFTTKESTFNAFSKVISTNLFGLQHQMDPNKNKYDFLVLLDNDTIVLEGWDSFLLQAWKDVEKFKLSNIKVISQLPGSIMNKHDIPHKICGYNSKTGKSGGGEFWCVRNNFFEDVGFLDVKPVIGLDKKHDQNYWPMLEASSMGKDYILGTERRLCIHAGGVAGSLCNTLTRNRNTKNRLDLIKFEQQEEDINRLNFDEFYKSIKDNKELLAGF